jgi:hypothetical protein
MTVVCPHGHASQTTDYCDECGAPISVAQSSAAAPGATEVLPAVDGHDDDEDTSTTAQPEPCPVCGIPRSGCDFFCEACGHDFRDPPGASGLSSADGGQWEVIVRSDRGQCERVAGPGLDFPAEVSERRMTLAGDQVRIGRSRGSGGSAAELDLAGPFEDPGISRLHAVLERRADGSYTVRDLGSTNGTMLGEDLAAVGTDTATPLADGDVIRIGAWTTITVHSR